ncbi:MAG TPA: hypothetical protein VGO58_05010 [Chitinophagaceae bacterium]|jgi:hypothetical protein|nr:hypothetical protein [Chitinophagaceae bacterium]
MSNKYGRQHGGSNVSPGLIWIGGLAIVAAITRRVIKAGEKVKEIHSAEQEELDDRQFREVFLEKNPVTGKIDTIIL